MEIRLDTRLPLSQKILFQLKRLVLPFCSITLAFLIGAVIISLLGLDPIKAYSSILQGSLSNPKAIAETLIKTTPLIFTGLSFALAKRCGMINIGAEGQLYMGGFFASVVGIYLKGLPAPLHILLAVIAAFVGGGLWGLFAAFLKVKFGASEIITTIMLNYIALHFISYLVTGPMKEPPGTMPQSPPILDSAILPRLIPGTRLHIGILFALLAVLVFYLFLWRTTVGYETRVVGINPDAAQYAGMNPNRRALLAMFMAGGFAGMAGLSEILGIQLRMYQNFSGGYGFDGIAIALLGGNTPVGIVFSSLLFGILRSGSNLMEMQAKVPKDVIFIIQAMVIMFVAGGTLFGVWKKHLANKKRRKGEQ